MNRTTIGVIASTLWLLLWATFGYINWNPDRPLTLNEWGDFLAGVTSPLAFLWLIIGYFQQGDELRLSREALHLQAEELNRSVEQQRELVSVTRQELELTQARIQEDRSKDRALVVPIFRCKVMTEKSANNQLQLGIRVSNSGYPVTEVFFSTNCVNVTPHHIPLLDSGSDIHVMVVLEAAHKHDFRFHIACKGVFGEDLRYWVPLSRAENNELFFGLPEIDGAAA